MKKQPTYLLWEGIPFLMVVGIFGLLSLVNWGYESKLIYPDNSSTNSTSAHLGLTLLAIAFGQTSLASVILFAVRRLVPGPGLGWFASLTLVALFLIFPALFIVVLGPASITMMEQMRAAH